VAGKLCQATVCQGMLGNGAGQEGREAHLVPELCRPGQWQLLMAGAEGRLEEGRDVAWE
jgi:hypothetical protein